MALTHRLIFRTEMPWILEAGRESLSKIGNWYLLKDLTYIRLIGLIGVPHLLPKYVPNRILVKEFTFQIFEVGLTVGLLKRKVRGWLEMTLTISPFQIINQDQAQNEIEGYLDFKWMTTPLRNHDPMGYIAVHHQKLGLATSYRHDP